MHPVSIGSTVNMGNASSMGNTLRASRKGNPLDSFPELCWRGRRKAGGVRNWLPKLRLMSQPLEHCSESLCPHPWLEQCQQYLLSLDKGRREDEPFQPFLGTAQRSASADEHWMRPWILSHTQRVAQALLTSSPN